METYENLIRVELIDDPEEIAERRDVDGLDLYGEAHACSRCCKRGATIAAILIVPAGGDSCWALCAECLRAMPDRKMLS